MQVQGHSVGHGATVGENILAQVRHLRETKRKVFRTPHTLGLGGIARAGRGLSRFPLESGGLPQNRVWFRATVKLTRPRPKPVLLGKGVCRMEGRSCITVREAAARPEGGERQGGNCEFPALRRAARNLFVTRNPVGRPWTVRWTDRVRFLGKSGRLGGSECLE